MAKKSMQQLLLKKKQLLRSPVITSDIQNELAKVNHQIDKKTDQSDQNFFRTFYKTAKEQLPNDEFLKVEDIASTRTHDYRKKSGLIDLDLYMPTQGN